jgi:ribosomal protein S13
LSLLLKIPGISKTTAEYICDEYEEDSAKLGMVTEEEIFKIPQVTKK